ncbi:40S ribosomal protein S5-1 [Hordeum vulgare]|nr:40S ribosomal protein S5-1 [Hordeum vulgare]
MVASSGAGDAGGRRGHGEADPSTRHRIWWLAATGGELGRLWDPTTAAIVRHGEGSPAGLLKGMRPRGRRPAEGRSAAKLRRQVEQSTKDADKFFEKVINPYLAGVLQHPQSIEMHEGVRHIRDVEGAKKTGSVEVRLEIMEEQVFKCQGMVERRLNANHMMTTEFTNKHKIDSNDIGKHLSRLYDRIDHLQAQIYDLQNQNCE